MDTLPLPRLGSSKEGGPLRGSPAAQPLSIFDVFVFTFPIPLFSHHWSLIMSSEQHFPNKAVSINVDT